jgi:hypothetical protein
MASFLLEATPMAFTKARSLRLGLLLALVACEDTSIDTSRERGDLGRGKFIYECLGETDASCTTATTSFPQAVAVQSRFAMRFAIDEGAQPTVIPGSSNFVEQVTGGFKVVRSGELALLAVTGNREVIDLKHLRGADIASVRVQRAKSLPESRLQLAADETVEVLAIPMDAQGVVLGGALDYRFSSEQPAIVRIETLAELNRVRIRAISEGETNLSIEVGGKTYMVPVESAGGAGPEPDAGEPEGDAGDDAGPQDESDAGVENDGGEA